MFVFIAGVIVWHILQAAGSQLIGGTTVSDTVRQRVPNRENRIRSLVEDLRDELL